MTKVDLRIQAGVFVSLLVIVLLLQWSGNAYRAEPLSQGDEAAHLVTGLMVHDYLASGKVQNPMRFAENYYIHYPQVALGHWPPVFYGVQALWMLVLPPSRMAVLLLLATLGALVCFRVFQVISRSAPWQAAFACAVLLAILAPMQQYTRLILSEMLLAWLTLEASLAFAKWLEAPSFKWAITFGILAAGAILTKATGAGLGFLPMAAIALSRRWRLLLQPSLWLGLIIIVALCAPWYMFAPGARHEANIPMGGLIGVDNATGGSGKLDVATAYPALHELWQRTRWSLDAFPILLRWMGPLFLLVLWAGWKGIRGNDPLALVGTGLLAGFLLFRFILMVAAAHERLLLPVLPPLALLIWRGCEMLRPRLAPKLVFTSLFVLVGAWSFAHVQPKRTFGVQDVVQTLMMRPEYSNSVFMVCADGNTEGAFVAEVAFRDHPRPKRYILRSSKMMASSLWNGQNYKLRTASPQEVMKMIQDVPVGVLIIDTDPQAPVPHMGLLQETVREYQDQFLPLQVPGTRFLAFEIAGFRNRQPGTFAISVPGLGKSLGND